MIGIYKIINKNNGKVYIGQSKDITYRWHRHRLAAFNKGYP
jgi:predicted GIY-YIG superfamily endonuclease